MRNQCFQFQAIYDYYLLSISIGIKEIYIIWGEWENTGNQNYENRKLKNGTHKSHYFRSARGQILKEKTLEREILKGVKGEGLDVVDEFLGNPVYAFF